MASDLHSWVVAATPLHDPSVAVLLVRPKGKPIVDQTLDVTHIEDVAGKPLWITYTNGARYRKARRDVQLLTELESEPLPRSVHLHHTAWRDRVSPPATILRFASPEGSWLRPVLDDGTHLPAVPESEIITVIDAERPAETEAVLDYWRTIVRNIPERTTSSPVRSRSSTSSTDVASSPTTCAAARSAEPAPRSRTRTSDRSPAP